MISSIQTIKGTYNHVVIFITGIATPQITDAGAGILLEVLNRHNSTLSQIDLRVSHSLIIIFTNYPFIRSSPQYYDPDF
jgi:hypothetical protein